MQSHLVVAFCKMRRCPILLNTQHLIQREPARMTSRTSLPKSKIRILLLEGIHPNAVSTLNDAGYTSIETIAGSLKEEELIEKLRGVHMLGIRSRTQITRRVLEAADKLIAIGCFCCLLYTSPSPRD